MNTRGTRINSGHEDPMSLPNIDEIDSSKTNYLHDHGLCYGSSLDKMALLALFFLTY